MMKVRNIYILMFSAAAAMFSSCKDNDDDMNYDYSGFTDALVKEFTLLNNSDIIDEDSATIDLSSVFFSINNYGSVLTGNEITGDSLVGKIYNADSLAVGIPVNKLLADIQLRDATDVELYTVDDTLKYDIKDTIDFSEPVIMKVTARDEKTVKFYDVRVNVHKQVGDSLHWSERVANPLADVSAQVEAQQVCELGESLVWLVQTASGISCYEATKQDMKEWTKQTISGADGLDAATVRVVDGSLYGVASGKLLRSDNGTTWAEIASNNFVALIGGYKITEQSSKYIALVENSGKYSFAYSTDATSWEIGTEVPAKFPIKGSTIPVQYFGGTTQRLVIAGGETAEGTLTSSVWNYEVDYLTGNNVWQEFPQANIEGYKNASLVEYTNERGAVYSTTTIDSNMWMLFGGENAKGETITQIYTSPNKGVGFFDALPSYDFADGYTARTKQSVFVSNDLNINVFGGVDQDGNFINNIWKGRLNKVAFRPLR